MLQDDAFPAGTYAYMAPELLANDKTDRLELTAQADIYSLGVTLYKLVTGSLPVLPVRELSWRPGVTAADEAREQRRLWQAAFTDLDLPPPSPADRAPDLPPAFCDVRPLLPSRCGITL